jgi:hypothetical protein
MDLHTPTRLQPIRKAILRKPDHGEAISFFAYAILLAGLIYWAGGFSG